MVNGTPPTSGPPELEELPTLSPLDAPQVELAVRPKSSLWDRVKFLLLLAAAWWVLVWAALVNNPIESFRDGVAHGLSAYAWIEVLFALELLRQIHYLLAEHFPRWHRLFSHRIFGSFGRLTGKMNDWNRYRLGRVLRILVALALLSVILAAYFHTSPLVALLQVPAALFVALPFILQLAFAFFFIAFQFIGLFWLLSKGGVYVYYPGQVKTRFSDVWGQDSVLERVKENIIFLRDPEAIEARGGYVPGGILLWGPPGTGKTLIAEAVAGETENPFVFVDPGAFQNMFFGVGILKVKSLFRKLRKLALRYGGVVVFFDEADSLGNRGALTPGRIFGNMTAPEAFAGHGCNGLNYLPPEHASALFLEQMRRSPQVPDPQRGRLSMMMGGMAGGGGGMGTLQSLLSEMSGLKKPRGFLNRVLRRALGMPQKPPPKYRMLIMMATNMPNSLDEALLRPGRIDRIYKVGYPSKSGRIRTYEGYLAKVAHDLTPEQIERLAVITPYATGATIKDLVNESLIIAIREGVDVISWEHVVKAKQLKELGPPEDVDYVERERHAVAIHEACHAVAAARVRQDVMIDIATIEKGGTTLGHVSWVKADDTFTSWRSDFEASVMVSLASLAGEKMFFDGDNSSGVSGDLENATLIASYMEGYWGMGQSITSIGISQEVGVGGGGGEGPRGERDRFVPRSLSARIEQKLIDLLGRTVKLLEVNRLEVLAIAHALESRKTITGEDVHAIINGTEGPFIDGRRYHTDAFREAAEAYHHALVQAHRGHAKVELTLPELPELTPVGAVSTNGAPEALAPAPEGNGIEP